MTAAAPAKLLELFGAYSEILADPRGDAERRERLARLRDFAVSQGMCGRAVGTVIRDYSHEFRTESYDQQRFTRFYQFIFFAAREKGHKNLSCDVALELWRVVLQGRFRLLERWCEFVAGSNRLGITEDTWRQVLDFSRLVHEDLSNYDPQGAWPVLVDEFVDHLYVCGLGVMRARAPSDALPGETPASPSAAPAQQFILCSSVGSKRRAPCPEEVESISVRLSQLEASTSKRVNRGEIFSRSAQQRQVTNDSSSGGVQQGVGKSFSLSGPGVPLGIGLMDVATTEEESGGGYTSERVAAHFHRKGLPLMEDHGAAAAGGARGVDQNGGEESSRLMRTLLGGSAGGGLGALTVDMAM